MKIVISRTDAIGDLLLTLPLSEYLYREKRAEITYIASKVTAPLLENHPGIKQVWVYDKTRGKTANLNLFREKMADLAPKYFFHLGGDHITSFAAFLEKVPFRGGILSKIPSFLYLNKGVRQARSKAKKSEAEYNLHLLSPFKEFFEKPPEVKKYPPKIYLTDEEKIEAKENLFDLLGTATTADDYLNRPWVFVHPGMTGHSLNWPMEFYLKLMLEINQSDQCVRPIYIISYTSSDLNYIDEIKALLNRSDFESLQKSVVFFDGGKKGIRNYLGSLRYASGFIGSSTGTTHLANLLGIPQVSIYSPIKTQSELRWGPFQRTSKVQVFTPNVNCPAKKTCLEENCSYHPCMELVSPHNVMQKFAPLLKLQSAVPR